MPLKASIDLTCIWSCWAKDHSASNWRNVLQPILASADIYVTAGPHETFGLSVIEAEASGLPVVGVAAGALIERVPPEVGCLGPVNDAQAMGRNILKVREQRNTMSQAARRYVIDHGYGWEKTLSNLFSYYQEALSQPPASLPAPRNPQPTPA